MSARYAVGIDLGTSHTLLAWADLRDSEPAPQLFGIAQATGPGQVAESALLPSLRYHPAVGELADADLDLPWPQPLLAGGVQLPAAVFGRRARELGGQTPGRLVASAKSWLSHPGVDRNAAILPWGAPEGVDKISPVAASASYLAQLRAAWDAKHPDHPLAQQDITLTVPASFDEGARALTLEAARLAGLDKLRLVEEPQAALHDWLFHHRDRLADELKDARLVLVVDVGGGTTDLTPGSGRARCGRRSAAPDPLRRRRAT
jgi:molecular chaperone DnaK (HSP70)